MPTSTYTIKLQREDSKKAVTEKVTGSLVHGVSGLAIRRDSLSYVVDHVPSGYGLGTFALQRQAEVFARYEKGYSHKDIRVWQGRQTGYGNPYREAVECARCVGRCLSGSYGSITIVGFIARVVQMGVITESGA